jgi:hypothetical protein
LLSYLCYPENLLTETYTALSHVADSTRAGMELGLAIRKAFGGTAPDAIILFASAQHDYHSCSPRSRTKPAPR